MTIQISLLSETALLFMLIFARVGAMIMLMPAVGEQVVPPRIRLSFALLVSLVFMAALSSKVPAIPSHFIALGSLLIGEVIIGIAMGLLIRIIIAGLQMAGAMISFQTGLSFAQASDPSSGRQDSIFIAFFSMLSICLIFILELHHLFLQAIQSSYDLLPVGGEASGDGRTDFSILAIDFMAKAFVIAIQLSSPFIAFGLVFYAGIGVLSRLIPQIQVFFIAMPAGIGIGLLLLMVLLPGLMGWYMGYLETAMGTFLIGAP